MFWLLGWLAIGLVAGALARLLVPGRQPLGWLATMLLGLIGSVLGGFLSAMIFGYNFDSREFHPGGLVMSTIGAVIVLAIAVSIAANRRIGHR